MARLILVTGGARSGKSDYAQHRAEQASGPHCFVATCVPRDDEMRERVRRHQLARRRRRWHCLEAPLEPASTLRIHQDFKTCLIDCVTLWISNLMEDRAGCGRDLDEEGITELSRELIAAVQERHGTVIVVTNEVGLGVVPENHLARRYRDLVGRCNQELAAAADEVIMVSCGIPLCLKTSRIKES